MRNPGLSENFQKDGFFVELPRVAILSSYTKPGLKNQRNIPAEYPARNMKLGVIFFQLPAILLTTLEIL